MKLGLALPAMSFPRIVGDVTLQDHRTDVERSGPQVVPLLRA
ncbi:MULTISPECIES: hypothetical protein [unclassified Pseudonocardia]|jgi:hypothetical protein|nr:MULTISPECIES: hypothetical protein [unclassified Pseudonocardia]